MSISETQVVIKKGKVLLPGGGFMVCDLRIGNGILQQIGHDLHGDEEIDAEGNYVLPGLIDLHTHGIQMVHCDTSGLEEWACIEASRGATTFYPTLFAPPGELIKQMEKHRVETGELQQLPQIGGFRLESPYLAYTGAGIAEDLTSITQETTSALLKAGGGHIKIWDMSPEIPGALDLIRELSSQGIVCSLAHMRSTIAETRAAVDAGARLVTHLYDTFVLPEMTDPGVYPAGVTDYLICEDRVVCEIIGDGTHVHPLLVEKAFRCKTPHGLAFVTDGNLGAGLPPGEYDLPWGRALVSGSNNGVRLIDRNMGMAGSALTPIDNFRNVTQLFHRDLAIASLVCSRTPAGLMGLNKGEITVGKDADLILLDIDLELQTTIVAGETVYQKESK